jgi:Bacterial PH domain
MSEVSRWYPSKVDWWLAVVLAAAPVLCVTVTVATFVEGEGVAVALGSSAFLALIYLGLVFPMRYGITDDALVVRHGLVRQRIALRDIVEVYPTRNPLSSPALSLDRLYIRFGEGFFKAAMISPADKPAFLEELAARAGLVREGERLLRR